MINGFGSSGPGTINYAVAEKRAQIGANWFFWIAGISLVVLLITLSGRQYHPVIGLEMPQFLGANWGSIAGASFVSGKAVALTFGFAAVAFYAILGILGRKGTIWPFFAGMAFYALDLLLCLFSRDLLAAAFHGYALFRIFQGLQAAQQLGAMRTQQGALGGVGYVPPSSTPSSDVWPPPPSV